MSTYLIMTMMQNDQHATLSIRTYSAAAAAAAIDDE